jgi:hypothetical protein
MEPTAVPVTVAPSCDRPTTRPASEGVCACRREQDKRPDAGGRDSCGDTAPSSPPLEADCARPSPLSVRSGLPSTMPLLGQQRTDG